MSLPSSSTEESSIDFEVEFLYSGPEWVTNLLLDLFHTYLAEHPNSPKNWSSSTCSKLPPSAKIIFSILPLIEELNRTKRLKRNFYATAQDRKLVFDRYIEWANIEGLPSVAKVQAISDEREIPSEDRLTKTFNIQIDDFQHSHTFWYTKDGWMREFPEGKDKKDEIQNQKRTRKSEAEFDRDGNFIDAKLEEKLKDGECFRKARKGQRLFEWMAQQDEDGYEMENRIRREEDGEDNGFMTEKKEEVFVVPADSISNPDRHNFLAYRAAQGWDDDTSIGELGWDASPGNAEADWETLATSVHEGWGWGEEEKVAVGDKEKWEW